MGSLHERIVWNSSATAPHGPAAGCPAQDAAPGLSEFERRLIGRAAAEGSAIAAAVVAWHRETRTDDVAERLAHGLGIAALGALVMQFLTWTRLLDQADPAPATLRAAREVVDGPDPEVNRQALSPRARLLLDQSLALKAQARRISRLW